MQEENDPTKFTWMMIPPGKGPEEGHMFQCDHAVIVVMDDLPPEEGKDVSTTRAETWCSDTEHPGTRLILAARVIADQLQGLEAVQFKVIGRSLQVTLEAALANLREMKSSPPQVEILPAEATDPEKE